MEVLTAPLHLSALICKGLTVQGVNSELNNIVEQDHRAGKRVTRPMLGLKAFEAVQSTLTGIEPMHMITKRQWVG
jgi:transposase-like protein